MPRLLLANVRIYNSSLKGKFLETELVRSYTYLNSTKIKKRDYRYTYIYTYVGEKTNGM